MIGRTSTPGMDWYHLFDCSNCHQRTLLQGVMIRRSVKLLVVRIPLGRRWLYCCQSCSATWSVDEKTWRQRREQGVTAQEAYLERQRVRVLARRSEMG